MFNNTFESKDISCCAKFQHFYKVFLGKSYTAFVKFYGCRLTWIFVEDFYLSGDQPAVRYTEKIGHSFFYPVRSRNTIGVCKSNYTTFSDRKSFISSCI